MDRKEGQRLQERIERESARVEVVELRPYGPPQMTKKAGRHWEVVVKLEDGSERQVRSTRHWDQLREELFGVLVDDRRADSGVRGRLSAGDEPCY